ncbi:hypothetical protein CR513_03923, partial [Mucuna pruriens]
MRFLALEESKDLKKVLIEKFHDTLKVHEIEINKNKDQRKRKSIALKVQKDIKRSSSKAFDTKYFFDNIFKEDLNEDNLSSSQRIYPT